MALFSRNATTKKDILEVGCSVDGARVVVLVQCAPEWGATRRARGLLARAAADGGTAHQIIVIIIVLLAALLVDAPEDNSQNTQYDGTADTDHDTDDNLLIG